MLSLALATTGCGGPSAVMGTPPAVDRLDRLSVGVSTKDQVRQIIGRPSGKGASRSPDFPGYRDLWSYQVFATDGATSEYTILLVFFKGDIFDGYMWFDNVHEFEVTS